MPTMSVISDELILLIRVFAILNRRLSGALADYAYYV